MISINAKRLMAYVLAMAMLLAGLVYVPKTADAAEEDTATPEVSVMGATLRLSGENDNKGTQSMRVGIKVSNASKAKSCAIKLAVNGKSYTVSTEPVEKGKVDKQHNFVHSHDDETDSIVYAVVITGIPEGSFHDKIRITGYANEIKENESDEEIEHKSSTEVRNVMGVVESMQRKYPKLNITMEKGILYTDKVDDDGNTSSTPLTIDDFKDEGGYEDNNNHPSELGEIVDLKTISPVVTGKPGATGSYDEATGQVTINDDSYTDGYLFELPETAKLGDKVHVKINGSFTGSHNAFRTAITPEGTANWDQSDIKKVDKGTEEEELNFDYTFTMQEKGGQCNGKYLRITSLSSWDSDGANPITNLTINKITVVVIKPVVLEPGEVDLSTMYRIDGTPTGEYDETTATVNIINDEANSRYLFELPKDLALEAGDKIKVTVNGNFAGENNGFRVMMTTKDGGGWDRSDQGKYEPAVGKVNYTCTLTLNKADGDKPFRPDEKTYITIAHYGKPIKNLTINKITVTKLAPGEIDLSTVEPDDGATGRYDVETGNIIINDTDYKKYLFKLPTELAAGDRVRVSIDGKITGEHKGFRVIMGIKAGSDWNKSEIENVNVKDSVNYTHTFTMTDAGQYLIVAGNWGAPITNLTINRIIVTKLEPDEVDLSSFEPDDGAKGKFDMVTGKMIINDTENKKYLFKLPTDVAAGDKVKVSIKGNLTDKNNGFRVILGIKAGGGWDKSEIEEINAGDAREVDYTHTFTMKDAGQYLIIAGLNWQPITNFTIDNITVTKETPETPETPEENE